jgi:hypothetical protein
VTTLFSKSVDCWGNMFEATAGNIFMSSRASVELSPWLFDATIYTFVMHE